MQREVYMKYEVEIVTVTTFVVTVEAEDGDQAGDKGTEIFYQQMKAMKESASLKVSAFDVKDYFVYPRPGRE